jgi:glycosyl transferase family 25
MRVHVINLRESAARRLAVERRLHLLGVEFEIERAVAGRAGYDYFEDCDLWHYWLDTGRSPSDGEIGCYASHLLLWQRCVASGEPLVVMEDDAAPLATFGAALETARRLIGRYGFLRLEYDGPGRPARTRRVEAAGEFSVHYFLKYPYGAMCYALTPPVARAFLAASRVVRAPVDLFVKQCWIHGQPLFGLLPYSVREASEATASTILGRDKELSRPVRRVRRLVHKLQTSFKRAAFNQTQIPRLSAGER